MLCGAGSETVEPGVIPGANEPDATPTVVIGYDARSGGEDALALGRAMCEAIGARPLVLSVVPWPRFMYAEQLRIAIELETGEDLDRASSRLGGLDPLTKAIAHRSVPDGLALVADAEDSAAIVIGSSHRSSIGRVLLGNVGASLLHGAPCSVIVAPTGYCKEEHDLTRIGVAFDGSPESWCALDTGIFLAGKTGANLALVTVVEIDLPLPHPGWPALSTGELAARETEFGQEILDEAVSKVPDAISASGTLIRGSAVTELPKASAGFDLMIVGSRGSGPAGRVLLGSVSRALLGDAPCPVMVTPRDSALMRHQLAGLRAGAGAK